MIYSEFSNNLRHTYKELGRDLLKLIGELDYNTIIKAYQNADTKTQGIVSETMKEETYDKNDIAEHLRDFEISFYSDILTAEMIDKIDGIEPEDYNFIREEITGGLGKYLQEKILWGIEYCYTRDEEELSYGEEKREYKLSEFLEKLKSSLEKFGRFDLTKNDEALEGDISMVLYTANRNGFKNVKDFKNWHFMKPVCKYAVNSRPDILDKAFDELAQENDTRSVDSIKKLFFEFAGESHKLKLNHAKNADVGYDT